MNTQRGDKVEQRHRAEGRVLRLAAIVPATKELALAELERPASIQHQLGSTVEADHGQTVY